MMIIIITIMMIHLVWTFFRTGAGRSSEVDRSLMVRWVVGSILHGVDPLSYFSDPLSYFSFQPMLHYCGTFLETDLFLGALLRLIKSCIFQIQTFLVFLFFCGLRILGAFAHGAKGRRIHLSLGGPIELFFDWCNKGRGMCYPVCAYKRNLAVNRYE